MLLMVVLAVPFGASAATDDELKTAFDQQHMACKQGEDANGPISLEASDLACTQRSATVDQLKKRGYCWDDGEQQWYGCGVMN